MTVNTGTNRWACSNFIVAPTIAEGAGYTTIAAALTAASSGNTIFVKPGTYTEDLTLKAGVNLVAFAGDQTTPNVTIVGKITFTATGTSTISNIKLQTNSDYAIEATGANVLSLYLENCWIQMADFAGINWANSNGNLYIRDGHQLMTTGNQLIDMTGGVVRLDHVTQQIGTGTCAISGGQLIIRHSFVTNVYSLTNSASIEMNHARAPKGSAIVTLANTSTGIARHSSFGPGASAAFSIGAGCTMEAYDCHINSSNTNAVTGAGTFKYSGLVFEDSSGMNVTTQTYISTTSQTTKFTSSDTWTPDPRTKTVRVIGWGGGGGGGSGRRSNVGGANKSGGGGGACQGIFDFFCEKEFFGTSATVTIGAGGAGGSGVSSTSDGNNGTAGGVTSFGNISTYNAGGNSFGGAGTATTSAGADAPYVITNGTGFLSSGAGGSGSSTAVGGDGENMPNASGIGTSYGGGGGGAGGGRSGTPASFSGGSGGSVKTWASSPSTILAGGTPSAGDGGAGGAGNAASSVTSGSVFMTGTGGGGSGGSASTSGVGGAGAIPGGGGGGSGGATAATGNGGAGANGSVWVIEYF